VGKADYLKLGDWNAQCDRCSFKFKASKLRKTWEGFYVCNACWEPRHPSDFFRLPPDDSSVPWTRLEDTCTEHETYTDVSGNVLPNNCGADNVVGRGTVSFSRTDSAIEYTGEVSPINTARVQTIASRPSIGTASYTAVTNFSLMTYAESEAELARLASTYSATVTVYGASVSSNNLSILKTTGTGRPILLISCGIHGDEIRSLRGWFAAVEWLLGSTDPDAVSFRAAWDLYFIPLINPDGTIAGTRNNTNNVNLNRNWPYFFGQTTDSDKGASSLSEPETSTLVTNLASVASDIQCVVDVHDWGSNTTLGFLTEQIYHNAKTMRFQRGINGHIDTVLGNNTYSMVNPPAVLTEYRSKRKSYLYTYFRTNGKSDCFGGILELPEAESVLTVCKLAQDCMLGLVRACIEHTGSYNNATVVESTNLTLPLNSNSTLEDWQTGQGRPQWTSINKVIGTQVLDSTLNRNIFRSTRPDDFKLTNPVSRAGYASRTNANNFKELWMFSGRNTPGAYTSDIVYIDSELGTQAVIGTVPTAVQYSAAASDGTSAYLVGGYDGAAYSDQVLSSALSSTSMAFTSFANRLIITGGLQRHSCAIWGNFLIIAGGRDSSSYRTDIVAIDLTTKYQYIIGSLLSARGHAGLALDASSNELYMFGGWNGSSWTTLVQRITLVDPLVRAETDGETRVGSVFYSATGGFTSSDVGKHITLQWLSDNSTPSYMGDYVIATYVDTNAVTLTSAPTTYTTGITFTLTNTTGTASSVTTMPAGVSNYTIDQNGNDVYIFGGNEGLGATSTLHKYVLGSTPVVSTLAYTLASVTNPETGVVTPIEDPELQDAASYYSPAGDSLVVVGGEDETGTARQDVYEIDLSTLVADMWYSDIISYGYIRISSMYTTLANEQYVAVCTVKNVTVGKPDINPFVRLYAAIGPIGSPTRKIRTWYVVPSNDEYMTIMMPLEIRSGETELRLYLRHYTAGTVIDVANLVLYKGNNLCMYPLEKGASTNAVDIMTQAIDLTVGGTGYYNLSGSFVPLVTINSNQTNTKYISILDDVGVEQISITMSDTEDTGSDETNNSTITVINNKTGYSSTVTGFKANYNRSSGKEYRDDAIHWELQDKGRYELVLILSFYGKTETFTMPSSPIDTGWVMKSVVMTNGVHTNPVVEELTAEL